MVKGCVAKTSKESIIFILLMIMAPLGQISIDFYSTSLPSMAHDLGKSYNLVGFSTVSFLVAYGFGQAFNGVLCDSLGRRRLLLFTLPFFVCSTLLVPFSHSIFFLVALRFAQGLSVASVSVSVKAIAADIYKGKQLVKTISTITIIWGLSPILAPLAGSLIQTYLGWETCFYILGLFSLIIYLSIIIFLPETIFIRKKFNIKTIVIAYSKIAKNKYLWSNLIHTNLAIVGLLSFVLQTPELIQNIYHFTSIQNGALFFAVSIMYLTGTQLSRKGGLDMPTYFLPLLILILSFLLLGSNIFLQSNKIVFVLVSGLIMLLCGYMLPSSLSKCIQLFPDESGTVSGFVGFVTLLMPGILFSLIPLFGIPANEKFAFVMIVMSFFSVLWVRLCNQPEEKKDG